MSERFDVVVVGSGTGGGTVASRLAGTGARILVLERGKPIPQEPENWDPGAVWGQLRYRTKERWLDGDGNDFLPYTHYCVGGNSKFWGSVLYRLRREDFGEMQHKDGVSPAWPISYEDLASYYEQAERLYSVHGDADGDPTEPPRGPFPHPRIEHQGRIAEVVERLRGLGLHPSYLPLGLIDPGEPDGCILCDTCNSYPCKLRKKSDADVCALTPALAGNNVALWTDAYVERLITNDAGDKVVAAEVQRDGGATRVEAAVVRGVVRRGELRRAAAAVGERTAPRRSGELLEPRGPQLHGPPGDDAGRLHAATARHGVSEDRGDQRLLPRWPRRLPARADSVAGALQCDDREGRRAAGCRRVPTWAYNAWFARGVEWLAMSEDLPDRDNRVTLTADGRIRLRWQARNAEAHDELVALTRDLLRRAGAWYVLPISLGVVNTTHQCGTAVFGHDPATSVLDTWCRSHDVDNLFVIDGSFFPSSASVNPALTIAAQALRAADHICETHLQSTRDVP